MLWTIIIPKYMGIPQPIKSPHTHKSPDWRTCGTLWALVGWTSIRAMAENRLPFPLQISFEKDFYFDRFF